MHKIFNLKLLTLLFSSFSFSGFTQIITPSVSLMRNGSKEVHDFFEGNIGDACLDSLGYLRIFGSFKAARYDGVNLKKHLYDEGEIDFNMRCFKDDLNRIWVVKYSGRLSYLRNDSLLYYKPSDSIKHLIRKGHFESIAFDKDSVLHIGTRGKGYYKLYPNGRTETVLGRESGLHGFIVMEMPNKTLFSFSITKQDKSSKSYKFLYLRNDFSIKYSYPMEHKFQGYLSSLSQFSNNSYLLSFGNTKLIHFDHVGIKSEHIYSSGIIRTFIDSRDGVWVGTDNAGVHHFWSLNDLHKEPEVYLKGQVASVLCENNNGGIWLKSNATGLTFIPNLKLRTFSGKKGNYGSSVLYANEQVVYLDDQYSILKIPRNGAIETLPKPIIYKEKSINHVKGCLYYDSISNKLWLGGRRHISYYDGEKWCKPSFADEIAKKGMVHEITPTNDPEVMCLSVEGSLFWIKEDRIIKRKQVSTEPIFKLVFERNGKIWLAGTTGLKSYENGVVKSYGDIDNQLENRVFDLYFYKRKLWVVLKERLAYIDQDSLHIIPNFDRGTLFPHYKDGFWNKGSDGFLTHLVMDENDSIIYRKYDMKDRIELSFRGLNFSWGDTLFFPTVRGIRFIRVEDLDTVLLSTKLNVDQILINSKQVALCSDYDLNYDKDLIQFNYSGIHYHLNGKKIHFRHKLLGLKDEWFNTDEGFARFTSLDPGSYRFVLEARTDDSEVYCDPLEIKFVIHPPYWETWWFRTLVVIALLGLTAFIFKYQLKFQKKKDQLIIDKLLAEQQALRAQLNPHFIFNALSSIQQLVFSNDRIFATENIAVFAKLMRKVLQLSQKEWTPIKVEFDTLELYLQLESLRFEDNFSYTIDIAPEIHVDEVLVPSLLLQPIVENSVKHGLLNKNIQEGKIKIKAHIKGEELRLSVSDNGIGMFESETLKRKNGDFNHNSFGLNALKRRIEILNASYKINISMSIKNFKSDKGELFGTWVEISLPLNWVEHKL